jgi:hypothetical protein
MHLIMLLGPYVMAQCRLRKAPSATRAKCHLVLDLKLRQPTVMIQTDQAPQLFGELVSAGA